MKDNSSFSAFHHLQRLSVLPSSSSHYHHRHTTTNTTTDASRLSVWSNPGRAPGYLSRKYLQATVQKPNLVCGRLILSYYIPSVDSSGLDPPSPPLSLSLSTLFRAHFLLRTFVSLSPPRPASPLFPPCSISLLRPLFRSRSPSRQSR